MLVIFKSETSSNVTQGQLHFGVVLFIISPHDSVSIPSISNKTIRPENYPGPQLGLITSTPRNRDETTQVAD